MAVAALAWTAAADGAESNSPSLGNAAHPLAVEAGTVPLPPNWSAGTEAGDACTMRRMPICNQQTLAEMEAQGVPRYRTTPPSGIASIMTTILL